MSGREIKLRKPGERAFPPEGTEKHGLRLVSEHKSRLVGPDPEMKELLRKLQQPRKRVDQQSDSSGGLDAA